MTFEDWLRQGLDKGWISDPVCATHNALPMTDEETGEFDDGYDPCIPAIRVWATL